MDNKGHKSVSNRKIAFIGALGALTVLLAVTRLGLIPWFSGASITILHVPVILGTLLEGLVAGSGIGAIFGICTWIMAAITGTGLDVYFINPLISVLPRLFIAPATYFVLKGLLLLSKKVKFFPSLAAYGIAAFVGTMVNSILVLGALVIAKAISIEVMGTVLVSNSILEALAAVVICISVIILKNVAVSLVEDSGTAKIFSDEIDEEMKNDNAENIFNNDKDSPVKKENESFTDKSE